MNHRKNHKHKTPTALPWGIYSLALGWTVPAFASTGAINTLGYIGGATTGGLGTGIAINASGQVTGFSSVPSLIPYHAFLYSGGSMGDLGAMGPANTSKSSGNSINASGQVTGWTNGPTGSIKYAFEYSGVPGAGGSMISLGTLGGTSSSGYGINASGTVVGYAQIPGDINHAFIDGGVMTDLGTLSGGESVAYGINDNGQVTGESDGQGFFYNGTMIGLGSGVGYAVNASGQVVGTSGNRPVIYTGVPGHGSWTNLGTNSGVALAINSQADVTGYNTSALGDQAFVYAGGKMIDLNAWLGATNPTESAKWNLTKATGITDSGLITGYGTYNNWTAAFVLDASAITLMPRWNIAGSGNWSTAANWDVGAAPNSQAATATFGNSIGNSSAIVTLTSSQIVGTINFNNNLGGSYAIAGTGHLMIDDTGDVITNPQINVSNGSHSIGVPIDLTNGVNINFLNNSSLTISNTIAGAGPMTVNGAGTLTTSSLNPPGSLSILSGAKVVLAPSINAQTVASLNFDDSASRLDIKNDELFITTTPAATIRNFIVDGSIMSSLTDASHGIGCVSSGGGSEVRYTLKGDINLDGTVNFIDLLALAQNYNTTATTWSTGDLNYDGTTNFIDLLALAQNYNSSLAPDWDLALREVSAVPEPGAFGLVVLGIGLISRRQRSHAASPRTSEK